MKNLYKALAEFQRECPTILKETEGYGYSYADLPAIFEVIMPLLKKHDLGFTQLLQADGLETIVFHVESGEEIRSVTSIPQGVQLAKMNTYQAMGSAYTYYKRYALSAMLGLVTDKDTDAQDAPATPARSAQPKFTSPAAVASIHVCRDCGAPEIRKPKMLVEKTTTSTCPFHPSRQLLTRRSLPTSSF